MLYSQSTSTLYFTPPETWEEKERTEQVVSLKLELYSAITSTKSFKKGEGDGAAKRATHMTKSLSNSLARKGMVTGEGKWRT